MSDLIKNEAEFLRNCATDIETGDPLDDDMGFEMMQCIYTDNLIVSPRPKPRPAGW